MDGTSRRSMVSISKFTGSKFNSRANISPPSIRQISRGSAAAKANRCRMQNTKPRKESESQTQTPTHRKPAETGKRPRKMERIRSRIVEEIVSAVLTIIYHISCVFLFVPRVTISLAQRLYITFFGINLKDKVILD